MRLYLNAKSKSHRGYTPDWLKVSYNENGINYDLTLDIQGDIDYDPECLDCRCKGDLNPWALYSLESGEDIDLSELSEDEVDAMFPVSKIIEILRKGTEFVVGVYPVDDTNYCPENTEDDLSEGTGSCELWDGETAHIINFKFMAEFY